MKKIRQRKPISSVQASVQDGLTSAQVKERIDAGYRNVSSSSIDKSYARIIAENAFTFFNCVLYAIAIIFLVLILYIGNKEPETLLLLNLGATKFIFLISVLMNVVIGSVQGIRSKMTLKKLRIVAEAKATAVRDGKKVTIPASEIVLDDILLLSSGEQLPVDMTLLEGEIRVDESLLTGEADLVVKKPGDKLFSGSVIFVGSGYARTEKVGDDTYASTLSNKVRALQNHKSELMVNIYRIINFLAVFLFIMATVVAVTLVYKVNKWGVTDAGGFVHQLGDLYSIGRIIVTTASFAIGMIPTGLVLITSITLAVSITNLSKQSTLIQELYSLENLSRVDVICLDKTGTLTDGSMKVIGTLALVPQKPFEKTIRNILGCFETTNMTSQALLAHYGQNKPDSIAKLLPFSSETKCSGYVDGAGVTYLMGAPDYIAKDNAEAMEYVEQESKKGHRVIAVTQDGEVLGLVSLQDGIRTSAKATINFFYENHVDVKIISGDNAMTVSRIAAMAGVHNAEKAISLEGVPLEKIPEIIDDYVIFARVSPEQKQALVEALQRKGHKVAMTGDGVNDILALRKANASITFANATDAAKSCADVVLLDNDFSHLEGVVLQGRRVVNNIERTSVFFLMKTIAIAGLAFFLIPFREAQLVYSLENVYLLETAIIGTGGFLLSLEPRKTPIRGKFLRNVLFKAAPSGILVFLGAAMPVVLFKSGVIDGLTMNSMISSMTALGGLTVVISMSIPFNRWRTVAVLLTTGNVILFALALPTVFIGAESLNFNADTISLILHETFQPWNAASIARMFVKPEGGFNAWSIVPMLVFVAVMIPVYYIVMRQIKKTLKRILLKEKAKEAAALEAEKKQKEAVGNHEEQK